MHAAGLRPSVAAVAGQALGFLRDTFEVLGHSVWKCHVVDVANT